MKKILNILVMATAIMVIQACGSLSEKKSTSDNKAMEQNRTERAEKRRIERQKMAASTPTYMDINGETIYVIGEVDPAFNGGNEAMKEYLQENVKYPEAALNREDEGTVFVDFIVAKNGSIRAVEITDIDSKSVDESLRIEAIRVVSSMPAWSPGSQQGNAVNVKFSIPITFQVI